MFTKVCDFLILAVCVFLICMAILFLINSIRTNKKQFIGPILVYLAVFVIASFFRLVPVLIVASLLLIKVLEGSFINEQEKYPDEITENMKDKCRWDMDINSYEGAEKLNGKTDEEIKEECIDINSYEDAEKLFIREHCNYHYISIRYNQNTVENFDKYISADKMRTIRDEQYRTILSKISACHDILSEEDYKQISKDFQEADYLIANTMDDIYVDMTFEAIKKAYFCRVISCEYVRFIKNYIKNCIKLFPDKIQELRSILDFINENMKDENFRSLEFYRKELDKLIYNRVKGFHFVCTTDEIREKMFDFLKPEYKTKNDLNVTNINWTTGVYDKESGIFLTLIYYVSVITTRCGEELNSYIVITDNGDIFEVINNYEFEKGTYDFRVPEQYEKLTDKIKEGIDFYGFGSEYSVSLSVDIKKKLRAVEEIMDDRCHRKFPVN